MKANAHTWIYKTEHWRKLRDSVLGDHDCCCSLCGKSRWKYAPRKKLWRIQGRWALHHLTYTRAGQERRSDVVPLCYTCHQTLHFILDNKSTTSIIQQLQGILLTLYEETEDEPV